MSNIVNDMPEILWDSLSEELLQCVKREALDIAYGLPSNMFKSLIQALHKKYGKKVVVLIGEYDKPILDKLNDIRPVLKP